MEDLTYTVIKSKRKTLAIQITSDGSILVRAPKQMTKEEIKKFVWQQENWIQKHQKKVEVRKKEVGQLVKLNEEEKQKLKEQAKKVFKEKAAYYARIIGVNYGRITIREQKTRWGSCSQKGNLNFNFRLLLAPEKVLDYVVVHELCHRKQMNHSKIFWSEVARVFPEYETCREWLRENGWKLSER
ncbi:MAG: SprT family zinc-dependent metalloprotease [Lachnospiraceae bacterium]|nr:SprT family zinc-dependent metalloprotease [Lachnospiraceae bacterium]